MEAPERLMSVGFSMLKEAKGYFKKAAIEYEKRDSDAKVDKQNFTNVWSAIRLMDQAYDEVSAIKENDLEE
jgi:hypothetical protein